MNFEKYKFKNYNVNAYEQLVTKEKEKYYEGL